MWAQRTLFTSPPVESDVSDFDRSILPNSGKPEFDGRGSPQCPRPVTVIHQLPKLRLTVSAMRSGVGSTASSRISAAGSGMCGVVMRTGGPSRS